MVKSIYEKIWELSPRLADSTSYAILQNLTKQLINIFNEQGRLDENPFSSTAKRKVSLPVDQIKDLLKNKTCLVTGGLGCVGAKLVEKLLFLGAKKIVVVDNRVSNTETDNDRLIYVQADICDFDELNNIFNLCNPEFVFHTAAQRDPGYAESHILPTVQTNVIGTWNVVKACENSSSVIQCVFSSTGKASRYYTSEVYAASKKICEYIFDTYARHSAKLYSLVRFTHIIDNSLMNMEMMSAANGHSVGIHSPGKYVTAQNASEAVNLLLNALVNSQAGRSNFLIVSHLEWPVESLEVALYYVKQTGKRIPIFFKGNPKGYCEKLFRGQMDWSDPDGLNLLINVYENRQRKFNKEGDIIISRIISTDKNVLVNALNNIKNAEGEYECGQRLFSELRNIVKASLSNVEKSDTVKILEWGLKPQYLAAEGTNIADYEPLVSILVESLEDTEYLEKVEDLVYVRKV